MSPIEIEPVSLDELKARYRRRRRSLEPEMISALDALGWAGQRLDPGAADALYSTGAEALRRDGIPPDVQLSRAVKLHLERGGSLPDVRREPRAWLPGSRGHDADGTEELPVTPSDVTLLMAAGLVDMERMRAARMGLASWAVGPRQVSNEQYAESYGTASEADDGAGGYLGCVGWMLGVVVAVVAGVIVAIIEWNALLIVPVVIGAVILGYPAMMAAVAFYDAIDVRWLRLGRSRVALVAISWAGAPVAAVLIAILVLNIASG